MHLPGSIPTRAVRSLQFGYVTICFALGGMDRVYRWLTKASKDWCWELLALKVDPRFEALKDDPRFVAAMRRIRLG